jgi:azurin
MKTRLFKALPAMALAIAMCGSPSFAEDAPPAAAPHISLGGNPRIVAYQLGRLSNAQLVAVERKPDDAKYAPVYEAILTRKGIDKKYRDEAVTALTQINKTSPVVEVLNAIGKVAADDKSTPRELIGILMAQKPADLAAQKDKIQSMATDSENDLVKQAAYAALAVADGKPDAVWQLASSKDALKSLLAGIPLIKDATVRGAFYPQVNPLVEKDGPTQVAAIDAIGSIPGHEADVFKELAGLVSGGKGDIRDAAVRSIRRIPSDKWPQDGIEPLAQAIVKMVKDTPAAERTGPAIAQAVQLGNDLSGELEDAKGQAIRKELRSLAVPVVVLRTLREQMQYDTKYFAVEAGKPVEITLENGDAMPHNLVITQPGSMQEVAVAAGQMPPPTDDTKAYIPESPKILQSLSMVQPDESKTLTFNAPDKPGAYEYVCTFPGHWVRMYGVMLVVPSMEEWEKDPKPPVDPLNHKPYDSQKNEALGGAVEHQH